MDDWENKSYLQHNDSLLQQNPDQLWWGRILWGQDFEWHLFRNETLGVYLKKSYCRQP